MDWRSAAVDKENKSIMKSTDWQRTVRQRERGPINLLSRRCRAQPRLKSWGGPRFGSQQRGAARAPRPASRPAKCRAGCWVREGVAPSRCEGLGYHPQNFENLDAKSCILVTTCCEISCFLKTTAKKLGGPIYCWSPNLKVAGPVFPVPTVVAPMGRWHPKIKIFVSLSLSLFIYL